jgi:hypothetical protein
MASNWQFCRLEDLETDLLEIRNQLNQMNSTLKFLSQLSPFQFVDSNRCVTLC